MANWWLDSAQRQNWMVETRSGGKRRPDQTACDAVFKIVLASRPSALPVFLVRTQHWDRKHYPHYQLQIPDQGELKAAAGPGAEPAVAQLVDATDVRVGPLRVSGKQSISVHEPVPRRTWTGSSPPWRSW